MDLLELLEWLRIAPIWSCDQYVISCVFAGTSVSIMCDETDVVILLIHLCKTTRSCQTTTNSVMAVSSIVKCHNTLEEESDIGTEATQLPAI